MKSHKFFSRYSLLIKLISTICLFLCVPMLVAGFSLIERSSQELSEKSQVAFLKEVRNLSATFDQQIRLLSNQAFHISLNRKVTVHPLEGNNTWSTIEALDILADYNNSTPMTISTAIYFIDNEIVLGDKYKSTLSNYCSRYDHSEGRELALQISDYLSSNEPISTKIFSTFGKTSTELARMVVMVPIHANQFTRYDACMLFVLDSAAIHDFWLGAQTTSQSDYLIFSPDNSLIFSSDEQISSLRRDENFSDFYKSPELICKTKVLEEPISLYKWQDDNEYTFMSVISKSEIDKNNSDFYKLMRRMLLFSGFAISLLLLLTVYVNYTPILKLLKKVRGKEVGNTTELKTIEHAIAAMNQTVSDQSVLLMDYVLGNLLYGLPIHQKDAERLLPNLKNENFCIVCIAEPKFDNALRNQITQDMQETHKLKVFITDIPYKNCAIFVCICSIELSSPEILKELTLQSIFKMTGHNYRAGVGSMVSKSEDIFRSYMESLSELENIKSSKTEKPIIDYPKEKVQFFIQYIKDGEQQNACTELNDIFEFICVHHGNEYSSERYLCYDLLIRIINGLKQLNIPCERSELEHLLHFTSLDHLQHLLTEMTSILCERTSQLKANVNDYLQKQIVDYVNDNFASPDISLIVVSDAFGLSIYTLSRLFKDITGVGFKEYITGKRLTLSKELLLTTKQSISSIAKTVGFENARYFATLFKANYGVSPSSLRE